MKGHSAAKVIKTPKPENLLISIFFSVVKYNLI